MHKQSHAGHEDTSARKHALMRDGEYYRSGLVHAKAQIRHGARPEVLFHSVVDHATWALRTRADALLKPTGTNLSVLAPYALTIVGFIRKRKLGKPVLAITTLLGVAAWYLQRKRAQQAAY